MQHKKDGLIFKIFTGIILLLTILIGVQAAMFGLFEISVFATLGSGTMNYIKIIYLATGIATIIASVLLFVKVYLKK